MKIIQFIKNTQAKFENFVKNNKELMMIILAWSVLIFYLCLKVFFGYYIEYATNNENFMKFCEFIDTNIIANYVLSCGVCYVMIRFYYLAMIGKKKLDVKENIIVLISVLITNVLYNFSLIFMVISEIIKFGIIPIYLIYKNYKKLNFKCFIYMFVFYAINYIFQIISVFSRNLKVEIIQDSSFISLLLSLDVVIMLYIYYLYGKDGRFMGMLLGKWFGKTKAYLESQKQKKMLKIQALKKDISDIEAEIKRQENENK